MTATRPIHPEVQCFDEALGQTPPAGGRLAGRRILVVGAGQRVIDDPDPPVGNGRAISLLFAREGATLTCVDISEPAVAETCRQVKDLGATVFAEVADVERAETIAPLVERAARQMGGLDGLVMVVGISSALPIDKQDANTWDREYAVNVRSNMLFAQQAMRHMDPGSSIVLMSSLAALRNSSGNPAYESSKAAQVALARSIAMAGQKQGIRCNSLLPGLMDTPMGRAATARRPARVGGALPFGRQGTGWEVAYACLFLMSHESSYVNAHALQVDGGLAAGVALTA
ncbi:MULTISPECIES: SDR family NAD(P)-dependent oxidoreductase [Cupriavidus]|uniref:SDR family NAD(P)-dependent oxidoreductase n=1 Tax=Cupriavidus TaxID=106589 RepID=UPI000462FE8C|nr:MULTISPECIES: SDR family oxidoreductase [Cupriavidus]KWR82198.1 oxidoreductase [Cupriavidus sp. SHE]QWC90382.1 SDR family oxidoreductase [Cupriavidus metallidurans]